jgi:hypothetical protein
VVSYALRELREEVSDIDKRQVVAVDHVVNNGTNAATAGTVKAMERFVHNE